MRNILLYFVDKYEGDWHKVIAALRAHESVSPEQQREVSERYGRFLSVICADYPDSLKLSPCPPFVFFHKGDLRLLRERKVLAVGSGDFRALRLDTFVQVRLGPPKTNAPGIYVVEDVRSVEPAPDQLLVSVCDGTTPANRRRFAMSIADVLVAHEPAPSEWKELHRFRMYGKAVYKGAATDDTEDSRWASSLPDAAHLASPRH